LIERVFFKQFLFRKKKILASVVLVVVFVGKSYASVSSSTCVSNKFYFIFGIIWLIFFFERGWKLL